MALSNAGLTRICGTVTHVGLLVGGTEVAGTGYAREAITFAAAADSKKANSVAVAFDNPEANWGTVTSVGFYTAITAGDLLFSLALDTAVSVTQDSQIAFAVGGISVEG